MLLINQQGMVTTDAWQYLDVEPEPELDATPAIANGHSATPVQNNKITISAKKLVQIKANANGSAALDDKNHQGFWFTSATHIDEILPILDQAELIVIEFLHFRDGRGFTLAKWLKEKHHYQGKLNAAGYLLPDQFSALLQCGFDGFLLPANTFLEPWQQMAKTAQSKNSTLLKRTKAGVR